MGECQAAFLQIRGLKSFFHILQLEIICYAKGPNINILQRLTYIIFVMTNFLSGRQGGALSDDARLTSV